MEEWLEARTDLVPKTKASYKAYMNSFRKHFTKDPLTASPEEVWNALNKMTDSTKTKMLNMLSKYTGNQQEYGSKIRPLLANAEKIQVNEKPHFTETVEETRQRIIQTPMEHDLRVIYLLMTDHPALRLADYHSLVIGKPKNADTINWIDIKWKYIHWNNLCKTSASKSFVMELDSSYKIFKKVFRGKTRLVDRTLEALQLAFCKTNKKMGLKRGASMFRTLHYDQMSDADITLLRDSLELATKHNHSLPMAINRYMRPT